LRYDVKNIEFDGPFMNVSYWSEKNGAKPNDWGSSLIWIGPRWVSIVWITIDLAGGSDGVRSLLVRVVNVGPEGNRWSPIFSQLYIGMQTAGQRVFVGSRSFDGSRPIIDVFKAN